jgi:class 3 adenylate cyclase
MDGKFTASRRWSRRRRLLLQRLGKVLPRHGELTGSESDVQGIAVHLAARIMGEAAAGEVVVSRTVKDLVAGSGIEVDDAGEPFSAAAPLLLSRLLDLLLKKVYRLYREEGLAVRRRRGRNKCIS